MNTKELEAKVKMLEERIAELEGDDNKEWLWDADRATEAALALEHAFDWDESPYSDIDWCYIRDILMQIAREGNE